MPERFSQIPVRASISEGETAKAVAPFVIAFVPLANHRLAAQLSFLFKAIYILFWCITNV